MCAVADKKLSSAVGFKGIFKKVLIVMLVGIATYCGSACRWNRHGRCAVPWVCFYLSNEGVSPLENAAHLGLPIPEKLKAVLEQLHERETKDETKTGSGE